VYDTAEFQIDEALGWPEMLGDDIVIEGCPHRGRNVCENRPDRAALTQITSAMTRMTQALGADFAKSCDALFLFESDSSGEGADKHRVFALLTLPNYRPLFQDFTMCHVVDLGVNTSAAEVTYPFHVDLSSEATGLSDCARCFSALWQIQVYSDGVRFGMDASTPCTCARCGRYPNSFLQHAGICTAPFMC